MRFPRSICRKVLSVSEALGFQFASIFRQPGFNLAFDFLLLDDVFTIAPQEVIDGLDTNPNRAGRLVFVQIFEGEIGRAGLLDDAFDDSIYGSIVSALKA